MHIDSVETIPEAKDMFTETIAETIHMLMTMKPYQE